ncbi:MAG: hypothetical protein DI598_13800 [Pseudopedobacter saltans]|uniref:Uncharacterized protein n=1 Tax=Pseudopedobacter saltans TaxID=151895 RepID=A0A2W5GSW9_9SPHI|nr:MAG: hypothetical protein DI598_13800 [Pseudopedobacter saltans]
MKLNHVIFIQKDMKVLNLLCLIGGLLLILIGTSKVVNYTETQIVSESYKIGQYIILGLIPLSGLLLLVGSIRRFKLEN